MAAMMRLETTYRARTPMSTCGSSNGIFFETCIMPRMMAKFVLSRTSAHGSEGSRRLGAWVGKEIGVVIRALTFGGLGHSS